MNKLVGEIDIRTIVKKYVSLGLMLFERVYDIPELSFWVVIENKKNKGVSGALHINGPDCETGTYSLGYFCAKPDVYNVKAFRTKEDALLYMNLGEVYE